MALLLHLHLQRACDLLVGDHGWLVGSERAKRRRLLLGGTERAKRGRTLLGAGVGLSGHLLEEALYGVRLPQLELLAALRPKYARTEQLAQPTVRERHGDLEKRLAHHLGSGVGSGVGVGVGFGVGLGVGLG